MAGPVVVLSDVPGYDEVLLQLATMCTMQEFELPSQSIVCTIMKDITKDWEMKKEAVLLNHLSKAVVVTFRTERHARTVYDFLFRKKIIFKAPKVCCQALQTY